MPAASTKTRKPALSRVLSRSKAARQSPVPKPSKPYPGYMTDEWFAYLSDTMKRMTKVEGRARLVRLGINDEAGNLTAPYRGS